MSNKFFYEIATDRVHETSGHTTKSSRSLDGSVVWDTDPSARFLDTAAETISIYSDDSTDSAAGTGMRSILITGLDSNFEKQSEIVTTHATDGTIAVSTVGTYKRLVAANALQAGSVANNGIITIETSSTTLWLAEILPDEGTAYLDTYTVPASNVSSAVEFRAYLEKLTSNKEGQASIRVRVRPWPTTNPAWIDTFTSFLSTEVIPLVIEQTPIPVQFLPRTDMLIDYQCSDKDLRIYLDMVMIEEIV